MKIKSKDLVLEIGSGDDPHPRADIICDRYLNDNRQRAGEFPIVIDRPFVICDGYNLPFKNKSFDYVICSHLLEHLKNPLKFVQEVMRVGKAGYFETPSILAERLFGWDFHSWFVSLEKEVLILTKKEEGERFGGFYHRLITQDIWFRRFFEENLDKFYVFYEWEGKIKLKINKKPSTEFLTKFDQKVWQLLKQAKPEHKNDWQFYYHWMKRRVMKKIKKETKKTLWSFKVKLSKSKIIDIFHPILTCPNCQSGSLNYYSSFITCSECQEKYFLDGIIPVMLEKSERKKGF